MLTPSHRLKTIVAALAGVVISVVLVFAQTRKTAPAWVDQVQVLTFGTGYGATSWLSGNARLTFAPDPLHGQMRNFADSRPGRLNQRVNFRRAGDWTLAFHGKMFFGQSRSRSCFLETGREGG